MLELAGIRLPAWPGTVTTRGMVLTDRADLSRALGRGPVYGMAVASIGNDRGAALADSADRPDLFVRQLEQVVHGADSAQIQRPPVLPGYTIQLPGAVVGSLGHVPRILVEHSRHELLGRGELLDGQRSTGGTDRDLGQRPHLRPASRRPHHRRRVLDARVTR
ncbi:hypothetical protein ACFXO9_30755 [Nocardia tengchongensis]|uniref:hypothetical protein n=1 Tax=Nocardia tengchongensis TaxID=2055889 RepID=UPI00369E2EB8